MKRFEAGRITIGLFLHDLDETVGNKIYRGVSQRARELGVNLYCLIQGAKTEPEYKNLCSQLLGSKLDGIICGLTARASLMSSPEMQRYFEHFGLPLVSVGEHWAGVPSISFNNVQAVRRQLDHLVEHHGKRRIFMIRGPVDQYDANRRYQAFCEIMTAYGLFDPKLVSEPKGWKPNRQDCLKLVLGNLQPGKDFDAILAANDAWAIKAINHLQEWGFEVPEDIAVVGMNDSVEGQNMIPALTTVHLSFGEKGRQAVDVLLELIQGKPSAVQTELPASLKVRQSCGCSDFNMIVTESLRKYHRDFSRPKEADDEIAIINDLQQFFRENDLDLALPYVESLVKEVAGIFSSDTFFTLVRKATQKSIVHSHDVLIWWNGLEILENWYRTKIDPDRERQLEQLWKQVQAMVGYDQIRKKERLLVDSKEIYWQLHLFLAKLVRIFNINDLVKHLAIELPRYGIYSSYFVLYADHQPYIYPGAAPQRSKLMVSYNGDDPESLNMEERFFTATEFLPELSPKSEQPFNLLITALYSHQYQFGYVVCDYRESSPLNYKVIWPPLSACLRGIYYFDQRKKAEEILTLQKEELARSNNELQQFASIASHDLQEPLRKIITFSERLKSVCSDLLSPKAQDYLERIENATVRMQNLIDGLLCYSRVTTKAQPFSDVALEQIVREVMGDLEVKITETKTRIEVGDLPEIKADPLQMRQLFQNLISNGIKFQRVGDIPRLIIYAERSDQSTLSLIFQDNGIGIDPAHYERIFMVFERLHSRSQYEGSGVGLAICKKIVERHGGNIRIENVSQGGTRFVIRLPFQPTGKIANA